MNNNNKEECSCCLVMKPMKELKTAWGVPDDTYICDECVYRYFIPDETPETKKKIDDTFAYIDQKKKEEFFNPPTGGICDSIIAEG